MPLPRINDPDDGWNQALPRFAILAAIIMFPLIIFLQQYNRALREQTAPRPMYDAASREDPEDPGVTHITVASKLAVKVHAFVKRFFF